MVEASSNLKKLKFTVIGDSFVGKTSLITTFGNGEFILDHVPTVAANYVSDVEYNGSLVKLSIWDTCGHDEYSSIRPLSYNNTDVFIFCFSLNDPDSLHNLNTKWKDELDRLGPKI